MTTINSVPTFASPTTTLKTCSSCKTKTLDYHPSKTNPNLFYCSNCQIEKEYICWGCAQNKEGAYYTKKDGLKYCSKQCYNWHNGLDQKETSTNKKHCKNCQVELTGQKGETFLHCQICDEKDKERILKAIKAESDKKLEEWREKKEKQLLNLNPTINDPTQSEPTEQNSDHPNTNQSKLTNQIQDLQNEIQNLENSNSNQILLNNKKEELEELEKQVSQQNSSESNTKLYWGIGIGVLGGGLLGIVFWLIFRNRK